MNLPLKIKKNKLSDGIEIVDSKGNEVCYIDGDENSKRDAKQIIGSVNLFERLIAVMAISERVLSKLKGNESDDVKLLFLAIVQAKQEKEIYETTN